MKQMTFFIDLSHLLKTIFNCFQNPIRNLWVSIKYVLNLCACVCVGERDKVIDF